MRTIPLLALLAFCPLSSLAVEAIPEPSAVKLLFSALGKNTFSRGIQEGRRSYAAVIRCYDPSGTGNPRDQYYCSVSRDTGSDGSKIGNATLREFLHGFLGQEGYYMGMGQGWEVRGAVFRCFERVSNGARACSASEVSQHD
jgi:hypothetical protein